MAEGRVHVVGAGLAGLSTAVRLAERGQAVTLYEAQAQAGGRCRTFHDPRLGREIDNGNHLVLTGNRSVARYTRTIGAADRLVAAPDARFDFADLADGARWRVTMSDGPVPWWIFQKAHRVPGTGWSDYLHAVSLGRAGPEATVAEAIPARGPIWSRFWEPMTLAVLNTLPQHGQARLLWRVLEETILKGGRHARPMLAPAGLGKALVEPAVAWLEERGVEIRHGQVLRHLERSGSRAEALRFGDGDVALGPSDRVVLALPPSRLAAVFPEADPPEDDSAILNAFFRLSEADAAAVADAPPIIGVLNADTHWIFRRGDVVSLTLSAADHTGMMDKSAEELSPHLWDETCRALGLSPGAAYVASRINKEKRATFDQSPAGVAKRPQQRTGLANMVLAGDATDTGLPATIEGALRSGEMAAMLVSAQVTEG